MKKAVVVFLFCILPAMAYGSMSDETDWDLWPECVNPGVMYHFEWTVHYFSNDAEDIIMGQFMIGYDWEFGEIDTPPPGSVPGSWSYEVFPSSSTVEWTFQRNSGDGGGVEDGESVTFSFQATAGYEDYHVLMAVFGDVATEAPPHQLDWEYDYPLCSPPDDDTDDDVTDDADDDTWHNDDTGDDTESDDTGDDDSVNYDFDPDDDEEEVTDNGESTGCGC